MKPLYLCNGLYEDGDDRIVELRTISATLVYWTGANRWFLKEGKWGQLVLTHMHEIFILCSSYPKDVEAKETTIWGKVGENFE